MAQVQYFNLKDDIRKTAALCTVRYPEQQESWYRSCRKVIKEIPIPEPEQLVKTQKSGWYLFSTEVSEAWLKFVLMDAFDNKAYIVVDRKASFLGA